MSGKLYALSTGPGAADLITVRAARILGQLDVLYAPAGRKGGDSLALSIVREYLGAHTEVRCCHFPMSADSAEKEAVWNDVAAALAQEVAAGRQVGFITLGDAMLFSTWVFLLQRIGCPDWLEIVPVSYTHLCGGGNRGGKHRGWHYRAALFPAAGRRAAGHGL